MDWKNLFAQVPWESKKKTKAAAKKDINVGRLVYYEICGSIVVAIEREKQIKGWSRKKKPVLINALNPEWDDLYQSIL